MWNENFKFLDNWQKKKINQLPVGEGGQFMASSRVISSDESANIQVCVNEACDFACWGYKYKSHLTGCNDHG